VIIFQQDAGKESAFTKGSEQQRKIAFPTAAFKYLA